MKRVAIVILNWNGKHFLEKFLPDVIRFSSELARVVVADNASTDDSISFLEKNFPEVKIIRNDKNYGFTGGYNVALKNLNDEFFVLLNSDVEVTEGWLQPLLSFMDTHPNTAACQPKIRSYSDRNMFEHAGAAGGYIDFLGYPFCRGRIYNTLEEDHGQYDDAQPVFWATGACLFIRSTVYHQQGGFDDAFFAHMEEIDLCWRIQHTGMDIYVIPQSVVYHVGGGTLPKSNPRKTYYNFRNNLMMLFKNLPGHQLIWLIPIRLFLDGAAGIKFLFEGDYKDTFAVLKAHFSFYYMVITSFPKRMRQQKHVVKHASKGIYHKSIAKAYYLNKTKYFNALQKEDFS
ncbi:MAG: glycosyltransferase family 2 protein [Bacteroidetes bacterium]|nr:glycosyltransferase family 2 protein [Bacteroidota bacterium]